MFYPVVRTLYRGTHFSIHLFTATLICSILPILFKQDWFNKEQGKATIQWWSKRAASILGLTIFQRGKPFSSTSLIVANHISFLDIIVIGSTSPVVFLSKSSLRHWPVFGFIAYKIGTIFIQRNNKKVLHTITRSLTKALKQKQTLVLFPEGTTTTGRMVNKFHSSLFQAAINAGKPVHPVALRYKRNGCLDDTATYTSNDNFIINLVRIMAQEKTEVELTFCNIIENENMNRAELASASHHLISQAIRN